MLCTCMERRQTQQIAYCLCYDWMVNEAFNLCRRMRHLRKILKYTNIMFASNLYPMCHTLRWSQIQNTCLKPFTDRASPPPLTSRCAYSCIIGKIPTPRFIVSVDISDSTSRRHQKFSEVVRLTQTTRNKERTGNKNETFRECFHCDSAFISCTLPGFSQR